jgi:transmembrane sensor
MTSERGIAKAHVSEQAADEAAFWDARLRAPDCTDPERQKFSEWRDLDPAHRLAFEQLQAIVATLRHRDSRADVRALRDAALRASKERWWSRRRSESAATSGNTRFRFIAAAAVGVVALATAIFMGLPERVRHDPLRELVALAGSIPDYAFAQTFRTGTGQRSTVTLEDGSTVELNARSRVRVRFSEHRRAVTLTEGQAIFRVAKNPQRPFIVRAGDRDIVAVGTAFDVRLEAEALRVTLIEGRVAVRPRFSQVSESLAQPAAAGDAAPSALPKEPGSVLAPGEQLVASRASDESEADAAALVRKIDVAKVTGWRDGRVFLEDVTLADAVVEMNRYSRVQIRIDDTALAQLRVNGMFHAGQQQAFVDALQDYFPTIVAHHRSHTEISLARRQ